LKLLTDARVEIWYECRKRDDKELDILTASRPTDSEKDPQNWTGNRKDIQLLIITFAAFVPDFDSGIGKQFQMT